MGHARALLSVEDPHEQISLFYRIIEQELSVRRAEELARKKDDLPKEKKEMPVQDLPLPYEELKNQLADFFNTGIEFRRNTRGAGKIVIPFSSDDELERIIGIFDRLKV
jgi:ParB family chromosome partitioning protein